MMTKIAVLMDLGPLGGSRVNRMHVRAARAKRCVDDVDVGCRRGCRRLMNADVILCTSHYSVLQTQRSWSRGCYPNNDGLIREFFEKIWAPSSLQSAAAVAAGIVESCARWCPVHALSACTRSPICAHLPAAPIFRPR